MGKLQVIHMCVVTFSFFSPSPPASRAFLLAKLRSLLLEKLGSFLLAKLESFLLAKLGSYLRSFLLAKPL